MLTRSSKGDEKEATLCWKNALDQIRIGTAVKKHNDRAPKSETERTLVQSLKELEAQCKERIDLLEALRLSRQDLNQNAPGHGIEQEGQDDSPPPQPGTPKGWIGEGTIPAITYTELSRPPLPQRPYLASRSSSERAVVGRRNSIDQLFDQFEASSSTRPRLYPPTAPRQPQEVPRGRLAPKSIHYGQRSGQPS